MLNLFVYICYIYFFFALFYFVCANVKATNKNTSVLNTNLICDKHHVHAFHSRRKFEHLHNDVNSTYNASKFIHFMYTDITKIYTRVAYDTSNGPVLISIKKEMPKPPEKTL